MLVSGLALGLLANAVSSRGLELGRDHFPKAAVVASRPPTAAPEPTPAAAPAPGPVTGTGTGTGTETGTVTETAAPVPDQPLDPAVVERLTSKGLQPMNVAEVVALYRDPLYAYDAYLMVDARDEDHFTGGHIPGAWPFDPFRPEQYIEPLLPLLPSSMKIVVYCNGGQCEDSESAALQLLGYGADPSRLYVFAGGITAWREAGLEIERGPRGSGELEGSP